MSDVACEAFLFTGTQDLVATNSSTVIQSCFYNALISLLLLTLHLLLAYVCVVVMEFSVRCDTVLQVPLSHPRRYTHPFQLVFVCSHTSHTQTSLSLHCGDTCTLISDGGKSGIFSHTFVSHTSLMSSPSNTHYPPPVIRGSLTLFSRAARYGGIFPWEAGCSDPTCGIIRSDLCGGSGIKCQRARVGISPTAEHLCLESLLGFDGASKGAGEVFVSARDREFYT